VQSDAVVIPPRQVGELNIGVAVEPQIVLLPKIDLGSPVSCSELISLNERQVHHSLLRAEVLSSLHNDSAVDIAQSRITIAIIFFLLSGNDGRQPKNQGHQDHDRFSHFPSPCQPKQKQILCQEFFQGKREFLKENLSSIKDR